MTLKQKSHSTASVGTALFMLLLFLLLWLVCCSEPVVQEDEGIEVAFGDVPEAGGANGPGAATPAIQEVTPPPTPSSAQPSSNDLLVQDDEESLALQQRREEDRKKKAEEAERLRQEREAAEKAEAERIAKEKAAAEQRAKEQTAKDNAAAWGGLFGGGSGSGDGQGSGDTQGPGRKGNPAGHGSVGGSDWSLAGRDVKSMPQPGNTFTQEGVVVVSIRVDAAGKVVSAQLGKGSTISDPATVKLALEAAKKAEFTASDNSSQVGTITYHFKFK